jgi:hypothetical protein
VVGLVAHELVVRAVEYHLARECPVHTHTHQAKDTHTHEDVSATASTMAQQLQRGSHFGARFRNVMAKTACVSRQKHSTPLNGPKSMRSPDSFALSAYAGRTRSSSAEEPQRG